MSALAMTVSSGTFVLGAVTSWLLSGYLHRRKLADFMVSLNRTRAFLAARNAELDEATEENVRLETVNDGLKRQNIALMRTFEDLLQPDRVGTCTKVQIQAKADAEAFALKVATETQTGAMAVYKCPICPRHPVTGDRIFHVTHAERAKQGRTWEKPLASTSIRKRVSPQDIAALKSRGGAA